MWVPDAVLGLYQAFANGVEQARRSALNFGIGFDVVPNPTLDAHDVSVAPGYTDQVVEFTDDGSGTNYVKLYDVIEGTIVRVDATLTGFQVGGSGIPYYQCVDFVFAYYTVGDIVGRYAPDWPNPYKIEDPDPSSSTVDGYISTYADTGTGQNEIRATLENTSGTAIVWKINYRVWTPEQIPEG